ncbi:AAA family ATPase [Sphingomonas sp.]|uniref:ATP-dependent nuclease n=1 Tax=Sphingomonas sp. TaxID=28214 RepID=UPI002899CD68|nr:AAA family ATPase [Sphingomonas sp.]
MSAEKRSKLVRMHIRNIGCIGPEGISVRLDDIVCIVGRNNSGKSTILRAYELAQGSAKFDWDRDRHANAPADQPSEVILEIHIPDGITKISDEWKHAEGDLRIIKSRWQWKEENINIKGSFPIRQTKRPDQSEDDNGGYSTTGKASGADNVFNSRLPHPVRIGARNDPSEEEKALLKLVLEPINTALTAATSDTSTQLSQAMKGLLNGVDVIVKEQEANFVAAAADVEKGFVSVFPGLSVKLNIQASLPDTTKLIADGSSLRITDGGAEVRLSQQGSGAQRALFWTMLQVRNKLDGDKKLRSARVGDLEKKARTEKDQDKLSELQAQIDSLKAGGALPQDSEDPALPGYILLIDEPENALHPIAARAAQRQLYELASQPEWQVMLTTHSPLFINPTADHSTILRLERGTASGSPHPKTFRLEDTEFKFGDQKDLKAIQEMDPGFCEVFFGTYPIIVEGDTEHAAFIAAVVEIGHELIDEVTIIKANGKPQLIAIMEMLIHFKKDFGILHDCDWPLSKDREAVNKDGSRTKSGSWAHNLSIRKLVNDAKGKGIAVSHAVSIPDFERRIGLPRGTSGKPYEAYVAIKFDEKLKTSVQDLLRELRDGTTYDMNNVPECDADKFVENLKVSLRENSEKYNWDDRYRI